jgi:hypothetical protein
MLTEVAVLRKMTLFPSPPLNENSHVSMLKLWERRVQPLLGRTQRTLYTMLSSLKNLCRMAVDEEEEEEGESE